MSSFEYLLLMAACLLITLPLEVLFKARVYRRWTIALAAILPVAIVFSIWDAIAIARDHWEYNPTFVTGIHLGNLPLEELVFFVVIPLCALLSYEAVGTVLSWLRTRLKRPGAAAGTPSETPPGKEESPDAHH